MSLLAIVVSQLYAFLCSLIQATVQAALAVSETQDSPSCLAPMGYSGTYPSCWQGWVLTQTVP